MLRRRHCRTGYSIIVADSICSRWSFAPRYIGNLYVASSQSLNTKSGHQGDQGIHLVTHSSVNMMKRKAMPPRSVRLLPVTTPYPSQFYINIPVYSRHASSYGLLIISILHNPPVILYEGHPRFLFRITICVFFC